MLPRRALVVLATFLLSVLLYVDRACISTAKEPIVAEFQLTDEQWAWVLSSFAFGYALLQAPCGALADRMGARRVLSSVVILWSIFTGLTAASWNFVSLLVIRFLFGAGEAGAFPGMAKVVYSWIPVQERGLVKGINFSGSRLGAAATMPVLPWMIQELGWHKTFAVLMLIGFVWAAVWWLCFRDEPAEIKNISPGELAHIQKNRQQVATDHAPVRSLSIGTLLGSGNLWLIMGQYFASNFTFFFSLTWLFPYIKKTYNLGGVTTGFYVMAPLVAGAIGNIFSGWLVDRLHAANLGILSRRIPAIIGFALAAFGMYMSVDQATVMNATIWFCVALFGADMTLSPSWSLCIDIGGKNAGAVSGTMNMAGNLGSAFVGVAFIYMSSETKGSTTFFYVAAALNLLGILLWLAARSDQKIEEPAAS